MTDESAVRSALAVIPPDDRELWVRTGMSVHAALGERGRDIFHTWSARSEKYRENEAESVWRSFGGGGLIGPGTLFFEARQRGWRPERSPDWNPPDREAIRIDRERQQEAAARRKKRAEEAAARAQEMFATGSYDEHPYLRAKGFRRPYSLGLVARGDLLIPMRRGDDLVAIQTISPKGEKRFRPAGCSVRGAVYRMGRWRPGGRVWICEGVATARSVYWAINEVHGHRLFNAGGFCNDEVIVAFSDGGLAKVGARYHPTRTMPGALVVADNDRSGAGERAAKRTGLRYWMPPQAGDANDWHQQEGIGALSAALTEFRNGSAPVA